MRTEYFAYVANEYDTIISFTRHFSRWAAQKCHGNLGRHYRGTARSDVCLTIYTKEEMIRDLGDYYIIDWKARTLTPKPA